MSLGLYSNVWLRLIIIRTEVIEMLTRKFGVESIPSFYRNLSQHQVSCLLVLQILSYVSSTRRRRRRKIAIIITITHVISHTRLSPVLFSYGNKGQGSMYAHEEESLGTRLLFSSRLHIYYYMFLYDHRK